MDGTLRNTPALLARIDKLRDDLIRRFENLVGLAAIERTDRNSTATLQYQVQVETVALIRAAEDVQSLVRRLQEMWLFGQLKTVDDEGAFESKTNEDAKAVAELLQQLSAMQKGVGGITSGNGVMAEDIVMES